MDRDRAVPGKKNVARLDVTVQDPGLVRGPQRFKQRQATRPGAIGPDSRKAASSDGARTSSMTIQDRPSSETRSWIVTIPE
ncbi:MAG TPA: hypothetical protein VFQ68_34315 [Streptosporangiaceae bacterium]|nr:hypothetical protein [Streptosporangiaceae bacterium]